MFRKIRSTAPHRPSTRRHVGHVEHLAPLPVRDRYSAALAAGWRPLG